MFFNLIVACLLMGGCPELVQAPLRTPDIFIRVKPHNFFCDESYFPAPGEVLEIEKCTELPSCDWYVTNEMNCKVII